MLFDALKPHPEMFRFWPVGPYTDLTEFVTIFERYRALSHTLVYVVYDKGLVERGSSSNIVGAEAISTNVSFEVLTKGNSRSSNRDEAKYILVGSFSS